ncbi:MAG TPA: winged helix-turn-helix domain-containing protein [Anaeromyxobacter sp.]|nr:winged helix-turn-helix domain-containing protein [Anaeromyxobacter sp.]
MGRATGLEKRRLPLGGKPAALTAREFDVLAFFVSHPGRVYTREQLMQGGVGACYTETARTVDNFVARLRGQLGDDAEKPRHLRTVRWFGYRFSP